MRYIYIYIYLYICFGIWCKKGTENETAEAFVPCRIFLFIWLDSPQRTTMLACSSRRASCSRCLNNSSPRQSVRVVSCNGVLLFGRVCHLFVMLFWCCCFCWAPRIIAQHATRRGPTSTLCFNPTMLDRGHNEQGAEDVLEDLRAWCQEDGGPLAIGAVCKNSCLVKSITTRS